MISRYLAQLHLRSIILIFPMLNCTSYLSSFKSLLSNLVTRCLATRFLVLTKNKIFQCVQFFFLCFSSLALHMDGWFWVQISGFEKYYLSSNTSTCFIYALHVRLGISFDGFGFKLQMSDLEIVLAPERHYYTLLHVTF